MTIRNVHHGPFQVQHGCCLMAAFINETHGNTGVHTLMTVASFYTWKQRHLLVVMWTCTHMLYIQCTVYNVVAPANNM